MVSYYFVYIKLYLVFSIIYFIFVKFLFSLI
jgi:hypothetical protein